MTAVVAAAAPGCAGSRSASLDAPRSRPAAAVLAPDSLAALVPRLAAEVESLRGLSFRTPVPLAVVDDSTARRHFLARARRFWPEARLRAEEIAYRQLGLWPAEVGILDALLDVLEEQAGGYYDPGHGTLFILDDMPAALAPVLVAHELTHALDDQHHDIDARLEPLLDAADAGTALGAVVEGSGSLVMTRFMIQEMHAGRLPAAALAAIQESEAGKAERLVAAPELLQRSLLVPYVLGATFLLRGEPARLFTGFDAGDIDRAFRDPPVSTEQILHAEKYWELDRRDLPRPLPPLDLTAALGDGWTRAGDGTLGELVVAMFVSSQIPDLRASFVLEPSAWTTPAAAGWGNDRWQLYASGDAYVTVLATLWDSEADAMEFESALVIAAGVHAYRRADAVVLVGGAEEPRARALADQALEALAHSED